MATEPLWSGPTTKHDRRDSVSFLTEEDGDLPTLRCSPGTEVVVLTAEHYEALLDGWMHATVDLVVNLVRPLVGADRLEAALRDGLANSTPLADVIAELGLTQEEIDEADDA